MNTAIIVAAGAGTRLGTETPKQLLPLAGKTVLARSLDAFEAAESIDAVVVVAPEHEADRYCRNEVPSGVRKVTAVVGGGAERQDSVSAGLAAVPDGTRVVAVHDAVRPLIRPEDIDAVVRAAEESGAAVLGTPVTDTVKRVENGRAVATLDRSTMWTVQTPQAFHLDLLSEAHRRARDEGVTATDDTALVEQLGRPVTVVAGRRDNIKITLPEDLRIAERILENVPRSHRTGLGYDVHRLVEGRPLVLGGVTIPFERGLLGHSDADVLSHAVVDAVLGAVSAGDIGRLYPDSDEEWKDAPGSVFLNGAADALASAGARLANVDAVVMAQRPKLAPYIGEMEAAMALALRVAPARISVKATTTEGLGFVGAGEGIAAQAVATVVL